MIPAQVTIQIINQCLKNRLKTHNCRKSEKEKFERKGKKTQIKNLQIDFQSINDKKIELD